MQKMIFLLLALLAASFAFAQNSGKKAVFSTKNGAIKGYDPVAYFTDGKPVKGDPGITFDWHGAAWHFATAAHRDLFIGNPEKYAPQYGGYCAYGWAQGYAVKIDPEAWAIVDGKLYLNYDLGVQADWNQKQAEYIQKADQNWAKAHPK